MSDVSKAESMTEELTENMIMLKVLKSLIFCSVVSQVCNETDAQLIMSKYKKNTMKRKEEKKSFIQKQEDNVL